MSLRAQARAEWAGDTACWAGDQQGEGVDYSTLYLKSEKYPSSQFDIP